MSVHVWVNDRLHDVLGVSDKLIGEFIIGLAKKSSSDEDLIDRLRNTGTVDVDDKVTGFLRELYTKVGLNLSCFFLLCRSNVHFLT